MGRDLAVLDARPPHLAVLSCLSQGFIVPDLRVEISHADDAACVRIVRLLVHSLYETCEGPVEGLGRGFLVGRVRCVARDDK